MGGWERCDPVRPNGARTPDERRMGRDRADIDTVFLKRIKMRGREFVSRQRMATYRTFQQPHISERSPIFVRDTTPVLVGNPGCCFNPTCFKRTYYVVELYMGVKLVIPTTTS